MIFGVSITLFVLSKHRSSHHLTIQFYLDKCILIKTKDLIFFEYNIDLFTKYPNSFSLNFIKILL
jgi:hypothetical protein